MSHLKLPPYQKSPRKSYAGYSTDQKTSNFASSFQLLVTAPTSSLPNTAMTSSDKIPSGYAIMNHQVAGHTFQVGTDEIGMLKSIDDGSVLKPGGSPMCAAREIKFYEQLLTTTDPNLQVLKEFTSEFRGTQTLNVGNKAVKFIRLTDLTHGMLEPCVIDLKMGRRTWDPMATEEKKNAEEGKSNLLESSLFQFALSSQLSECVLFSQENMSSARKALAFAFQVSKRFTLQAETTRSSAKNTERNSMRIRLLKVKLFSLIESWREIHSVLF